MVVNGPAALWVINDAYHTQSTKDLLHFSLCPSFDAATDNTLMICGMVVAYHAWRNMVLYQESVCVISKNKFLVDVQNWTLIFWEALNCFWTNVQDNK